MKIKYDPTANVNALVAASSKRIDDLREEDRKFSETMRLYEQNRINEQMESERRHMFDQLTMRDKHTEQLSVAEAKRIDAIRAVDVNAVSIANERAGAQAAVLANQVSASAETLRALVAATATTVAQQLSQMSAQFTDRISALEKSQYEAKGTGTGMRDMWGWVFGGLMALTTIGISLFSIIHK